MNTLESKNIKLRALEPTDVEILFQWENDPGLWQISNTITPYSKYIIKQYIKNSHLDIYQTKQLRLMIDLKENDCSKTIGTIDLFDFDAYHQRAGVGVLIKEKKDRKKGYASKALDLFIQYCFETLQLHQLYCNISSENNSSLNLFQKHGFEIVGEKRDWLKDGGAWRNEYLLQRVMEE